LEDAVHELGITEQLLNLTLEHAARAGASRVTRLNLVIGELSSVVDESIQFYWEIMAKDSLAAHAELHFERVPARFCCQTCHAEFELSAFEGQCPQCGGVQVRVVDGDQFRLDSIEIENAVEPHEES
jgi:hydrogenase nickel incorporation protein HypA/HybF